MTLQLRAYSQVLALNYTNKIVEYQSCIFHERVAKISFFFQNYHLLP